MRWTLWYWSGVESHAASDTGSLRGAKDWASHSELPVTELVLLYSTIPQSYSSISFIECIAGQKSTWTACSFYSIHVAVHWTWMLYVKQHPPEAPLEGPLMGFICRNLLTRNSSWKAVGSYSACFVVFACRGDLERGAKVSGGVGFGAYRTSSGCIDCEIEHRHEEGGRDERLRWNDAPNFNGERAYCISVVGVCVCVCVSVLVGGIWYYRWRIRS